MKKQDPKLLVIGIAACLLGVVLALVGAELPEGTSFLLALPFWLTVTMTTAFLLRSIDAATARIAQEMEIGLKPLATQGFAGAATVMIGTIPVALMCLPIDALEPDTDSLFAGGGSPGSTSDLFLIWADQYLNLLPATAGFWLFIKVVDLAFPAMADSAAPAVAGPAPVAYSSGSDDRPSNDQPSPLARRFPEIAGRTLLAIEADEHYVRFHTDAGSEHVLYRFRDALKDVENLAGLRVHRSWWVAENAMENVVQTGPGLYLKLVGGLSVPVSQTYRRDVERTFEGRSGRG